MKFVLEFNEKSGKFMTFLDCEKWIEKLWKFVLEYTENHDLNQPYGKSIGKSENNREICFRIHEKSGKFISFSDSVENSVGKLR